MKQALPLTRRASLLLPLATAGCGILDWFTDNAGAPVRGNREEVIATNRGLIVDSVDPVVLPPVSMKPDWTLPGGGPTHAAGNFAAGLNRVWAESVGEPGDYRNRLTAQPIVAGSTVFTMDAEATVRARELATGREIWTAETHPKKNRSTNIGGGISYADGRIFAATGLASLVALDAASGKETWRYDLPAPGRTAPLIVAGIAYVVTIDQKLVAVPVGGKDPLWSYQAGHTDAGILGGGSPAFSDGLVVAGFESGDLAAVRADTGTLVWSDNLGTLRGSASLIEFASVRGMPVVQNGLVYAIGLGGLFAALDLRSGRRVWQRDVAGGNTPWVAGDVIFIISDDERVAAISRADGLVHWVTQLPRFKKPKKTKGLIDWAGPVLTGGKLLCFSTHEHLAVLDPLDGKIVSDTESEGSVELQPVLAQGYMLVLADDGTLTAYK